MEEKTVFECKYKNYTYLIIKVFDKGFICSVDSEPKGTHKKFSSALFQLFGLVVIRYSQGDLDY